MVISRSLSFSLAVFSIFVFAEKSYAEESTLQIGIGASVKSKYSGSNRYEYSPIPYFNYESGNGFFINSVYGLGFEYNYPLTEKIEFIAKSSLNYEQARRNRDELSGMDKIHATIMNETAFGIDFDHHLIIKMGVNIPLNKLEYGKRYYASVDVPFYYSKTDLLSFSSILYFFDHKYSQTYFGVTQSQSRNIHNIQQNRDSVRLMPVFIGNIITVKIGKVLYFQDSVIGIIMQEKAQLLINEHHRWHHLLLIVFSKIVNFTN